MTIETRFATVVEQTREQRKKVRQLVAHGRWRQAEPDKARLAGYTSRMGSMIAPTASRAEAIIGDTNDLQAAWFLPAGAKARRAVAYVEANNGSKWEAGSGFLVSPTLFLTNQHVVEDARTAGATQITFDREAADTGGVLPGSVYRLDPDRFAMFSPEQELDYALIAVGPQVSGAASLPELGYCVLSNQPDKHVLGMNVNIIQHPGGFPKMVAVRNNLLTARTDRTLLYETDTDHGSSGSPVFNDAWELVALHHYGAPSMREKVDDQDKAIPTNVNEGIRISAIYTDLDARLASLPPDHQSLLREALDFHKQQAASGSKRLTPPQPGAASPESTALTPANPITAPVAASTTGATMSDPTNPQELRVVVPIEVSIRVGTPGGGAALAVATAAAGAAKPLTRPAEKLAVDKDYSNRKGYDPAFIPGLKLALPKPGTALAKQVAPLRPGEADAAGGELKYTHFSIKMNKAKQMAIFTATNIDGNAYLNVDRVTGKVSDAEGETWYADPRVSASFFLDQTFYSAWSHLFDRGHLTRRMDPDWGTEDEAERANADTYHFTNCSPQHFRFNETTKYWQGLEQYVLENGAIDDGSKNRLCVFQGPIFDTKIDLSADAVEIPSSFYKVVVWKGKKGVRSVGLVVDQLALLSEERKGGIKPTSGAFVDVSHWRVSIKEIEKRTDLDFGSTIRGADTIQEETQPQVGEAKIMVKSFADLLPAAVVK